MKGEAEAFATEAKGRAEAEQMNKKAEAFKQYKDGAMVDMLLEKLPLVSVTLIDECLMKYSVGLWCFVQLCFPISVFAVGLTAEVSCCHVSNPCDAQIFFFADSVIQTVLTSTHNHSFLFCFIYLVK